MALIMWVAPGPMELLIMLVLVGVPAGIVLLALHLSRKKQAEHDRRWDESQQPIIDAELAPEDDRNQETRAE